MPQECRSCHAPVQWAHGPPTDKKPGGADNPLNVPEPGICPGPGDQCKHDGNIAVRRDPDTGLFTFRYLKKADGGKLEPDEHRAVSHYSDCPQAKDWRKRSDRTPST